MGFHEFKGFDEFETMLKQYEKNLGNIDEILEIGAKELAKDVRRLPKPRSVIRTAGHAHLIDTVTTDKKEKEVEVGWGKYYGRMVESGTIKMAARPHMTPTFNQNKERYYRLMIEKLWEAK